MTEKEFVKAVKELGIELTKEQKKLFKKYAEFLLEYNTHTNLTAIRTIEEVYLLHFYDSILMCKYYDVKGKSILDIGSGAGFPGVPLKICFDDIELTVLDSNGKKTEFLKKLKETLKIEYTVINDRAEKYNIKNRENFDVVVSRAVTAMPVLAELCIPFVKVGGMFIPYKGILDSSLENGDYAIEMLGGDVTRVVETILPVKNAARSFVFVNKRCKTDDEFPRSFDKISKRPLQK